MRMGRGREEGGRGVGGEEDGRGVEGKIGNWDEEREEREEGRIEEEMINGKGRKERKGG